MKTNVAPSAHRKKTSNMLKRITNLITFMLSFSLLLIGNPSFAQPIKQELHSGWKFRQERGAGNWYSATVPGVIHTDLIDNKIIEDPFFRLNERGVQWIDKEDWVYETSFEATAEILAKSNIFLQFKGLDTYADVYLNDEKILEAYNMFREWSVDVKTKLRTDSANVLKIHFHSPIKVDIPKWDALSYQHDAGNDQSENGGVFDKRVSVFARKAGYHYGWDWGPRLVTSGIWRPIYLEAWNDAKVSDVFVRQREVNAKQANISTEVEIISDKQISGATVSVTDGETGNTFSAVHTDLKPGKNLVKVDFSIENPTLWWSNGLGDAHLYTFTTTVRTDESLLDRQSQLIGLRSLRLINEEDKDGKNLYVELNGVPVFAKGANIIPSDVFLTRVTKEVYEKEVMDAVDANMNMLRVWGGGIYEDDYFYELCNRHGILVWQDFMFACSMYPADSAFLDNVKHEAIDNIKRLRNHPSIALWCGNNEITQAWYAWGWKEQHEADHPEAAKLMWQQYENLFHTLLPELVAEYAPESYYRPSSPYSRQYGKVEPHRGDDHYWGVWHAKAPISDFNVHRSRFFSEYGFQSFPEFESVKIYAPNPEDWSITSEVMMAHQRGGTFANSLIRDYLVNNYDEPGDFESFLYANHVLQGDAIKTAIEAHRRDMPFCMGTLYWQHNDCWPVASWSARDYYRRWKAQQYFAKEAFRDVLISPIKKDDKLEIFGVSDRLTSTKGRLTLTVFTLQESVPFHTVNKSVGIAANSSQVLHTATIKSLLKGNDASDVVIHSEFIDESGNVYENNYFLTEPKNLNFLKPTIQTEINAIDGGFEILLHSDVFARAVFLSIDGIDNFFSNNYVDILPGQEVSIKVTSSLSLKDFSDQLKVVSLNTM